MVHWIAAQAGSFKRQFVRSVLRTVCEESVREALRGFRRRERLWDGWAMLRTFLSQVMAGQSCRGAVERAIQEGWVPIETSPANASYCQARSALPETALRGMAMDAGRALARQARAADRVLHRPVRVVDGTGIRLPDSAANQAFYPQSSRQKPGCGFPVMYVGALMDLATGAILDVATSGGAGHERAMFREIGRSLQEGDILLADAGFGSYAEIAALRRRGVDCLVRLGRRKPRAGRIEQLGPQDWLVQWRRPEKPGQWIEPELLPTSLAMRVIEFTVSRPGLRTRRVALATTLLDPALYPKRMLMALYRRRWEMELRLREIKTTMGLEELRCKTPAGCRKELWMGLLGYNLIRTVMLDAARLRRVVAARISFAGTLARLGTFACAPMARTDPASAYRLLLEHLGRDLLAHRPNRSEPRAVKRRPKNYQRLNQPRHAFRECPHRNRHRQALI